MRTILAIMVISCMCVVNTSFVSGEAKPDEEYRDLRSQIVIYNLVNGLYLTRDQMDFILKKAREVSRLRKDFEEKVETDIAEQMDTLLALKDEVKKEVSEVSGELASKVHQNNETIERMRKEYLDVLDEAMVQVKSVLDQTQLYNIQNFAPCLVPPKGPARIGQDSSAGGPLNLLERIRKIPVKRYAMKKDEISDHIVDRILLKNPRLTEEEVQAAKEKILQVMDEIRSLSDVDFDLQKQEKAMEVKDIFAHEEETVDVDKRIAQFLLSPQIIPVLEEKLSEN